MNIVNILNSMLPGLMANISVTFVLFVFIYRGVDSRACKSNAKIYLDTASISF